MKPGYAVLVISGAMLMTGCENTSSNEKDTEKITKEYPNGKIKVEYSFYVDKHDNEIRHGDYVEYHPNGKKKIEARYA